MALPIQKCFFVFSLRQGTMLIALIELLLSAFGLFLLLLGCTHAQEMAAMLEADIEDSAQREGIVLSSEDWPLQPDVITNPHNHNEMRLHKAQHLSVDLVCSVMIPVVIVSLYTAVAMTTVHLFSCVLLLYGAVMRIRQLLLPWISIVLLGLVFCCTAMLVSMFLAHGYRAIAIFAVGTLHIGLGFYLWLIVYSHYRELTEREALSCIAEHHMMRHSYVYTEKPYNV